MLGTYTPFCCGCISIEQFRVFTVFLCFVYCAIEAVWGGNQIAILMPAPVVTRYITITFWRLTAATFGTVTPMVTVLFVYNVQSFFVRALHILIILAILAIQGFVMGWYIVDLAQCPTVAYCIGIGAGPLGIDVAFLITLFCIGFMMFLNVIFLVLHAIIKEKTDVRSTADYYSSFNEQPINAKDIARAVEMGYIPQSMVSSNVNQQRRPKYGGVKLGFMGVDGKQL